MGKGIHIGNAHRGNQHKTGRSGLDVASQQRLDSSPETQKEPGVTDNKQQGKHSNRHPAGAAGKTAPDKRNER